jgi:hypothetical protein
MLNRRQIHTLLLIRNREGNMLSQIPPEIVREISEFGQDPNGDAATLLHHVAYGEEEKAEKMLKANPELLLQQVSHVVTPLASLSNTSRHTNVPWVVAILRWRP